jgi:pyruvate formate lyase activating enzyme
MKQRNGEDMKLCGLQKTTLLDYPGHVAATIFLGGCNFLCPFCHNSSLIGGDVTPSFSEDDIMDFLKKRKGILEGVCITGGEPTLNGDLEPFIETIKDLGYLVKLDTNGYQPQVLKTLVSHELLDYVAMDIKAGKDNYQKASGMAGIRMEQVEKSAAFLMEGHVPWEFRTTTVKGIHTQEDFLTIGQWLQGSSHYYLQNYVESEDVLCPGYESFSRRELEDFIDILTPYLPNASLRGVTE